MENGEEFSSDSSDEDYIPSEVNGLSEEDDSGDEEDAPLEDDEEQGSGRGKRKKMQSIKSSKRRGAIDSSIVSRKRKGGIQLDESAKSEEQAYAAKSEDRTTAQDEDDSSRRLAEKREKEERLAMEQKKKEDLLWADFMKDTKKPPKSTLLPSAVFASKVCTSIGPAGITSVTASPSIPTDKLFEIADRKVEIVKEFKFAGETVKMSMTVDSNSKEAKQELSTDKKTVESACTASSTSTSTPVLGGSRRPAVGGLSSILGKIDKTPKMSTLVKSKLDWDGFKSAEGIDDELKIHNRGKSGYLERQAFLERTDYRQFEIEKSLRLGSKPK